MNLFRGLILVLGLCVLLGASNAWAEEKESSKIEKKLQLNKKNHFKRFQKGYKDFGIQAGWGASVNIPPNVDRTDWEYFYLAPNLKWNLTGPIGKSFYRGSLYWYQELAGWAAYNPEDAFLISYSPVMAEYKFLWPKADWAPYIFGGGGFAGTNINEKKQREIATNFEFLLHAGVGVEFYKTEKGAFSVNYRFFHISNAGFESPNIGVNSNLFTLGYSFK